MASTKFILDGSAGPIDLLVEDPVGVEPKGIAWVGHPHPLFGGTRDNKVVQTIARALLALGYQVLRQNFRGVGKSGGAFDHGTGETTDAMQVLNWAKAKQPNLPIVIAGFSFGSLVAANMVQILSQNNDLKLAINPSTPIEQIILVGTAVTRWNVPPVPQTSLIVHGALDDVIPLVDVQKWASEHQLKLTVIEATGHFFHGQLNRLKNLIFEHWKRPDLRVDELS
jgi:uncharacterized protein